MNIDIPDHVVFRTEAEDCSQDLCFRCAVKRAVGTTVQIKAICSTNEYDKCDECGDYL